jgi:hypothetical protein
MLPWAADLERSGREVVGPADEFWPGPLTGADPARAGDGWINMPQAWGRV